MKKVLIISYYYYPIVGGIRIRGLLKYLKLHGYEPYLLTSNYTDIESTDEIPHIYVVPDKKIETGKNALQNKVQTVDRNSILYAVVKKSYNFIYSLLVYPDAQTEWSRDAYSKAAEIINNEKIDIILSSSKPDSSHLLAKNLKESYNLPWIADFRDLWTQNHYNNHPKIRSFFEKKLEVSTISKADVIVTVSDYLAEKMGELHRDIPIHAIVNGFDPDEINPRQVAGRNEKMTMTYTGHLYKGKRDPTILFQAIKELVDEKEIDRTKVCVKLYGPDENFVREEVQNANLSDIVTYCGNIPREEALVKQRESDVLLLILWDHPDEVGVYTSKIFEYLASQRFILCTGMTEGAVPALLKDTNAGVTCSTVSDVKCIIACLYQEYLSQGCVQFKGDPSEISKYSHTGMVSKFADLMDGLLIR